MKSPVVGDALRTFVAKMIDVAWNSSTSPGVRNGLSICAQYVGCTYPMDPELTPSKPIRLGVFGTQDDVNEYFGECSKRH